MDEQVANLVSHAKALETFAVISENHMDSLMLQVQALTQQALQQQAAVCCNKRRLLRDGDLQGIVELQDHLSAAQRLRRTFVDARGIGRPATFSSAPRQFGAWALLGDFLEGVFSGLKAALEWESP